MDTWRTARGEVYTSEAGPVSPCRGLEWVGVQLGRPRHVIVRCTRGGVPTGIARAQPMHIQCQTVPKQCQNVPTFLIDQCFNEVSQTGIPHLTMFY